MLHGICFYIVKRLLTISNKAFFFSALSRSPSPEPLADSWQMETDLLIAEIEKLEQLQPHAPVVIIKEEPDHNSVSKLSTKLNGTAVSPKKPPTKGKI